MVEMLLKEMQSLLNFCFLKLRPQATFKGFLQSEMPNDPVKHHVS